MSTGSMRNCAEVPVTDFTSAFTYLPALCLIFWVGFASAFACLFNEQQYHWTPYLLVACYTVNWWTAAQLPPSWDLLPRGVSTWLAWVAYSHIFHEKIDMTGTDASAAGWFSWAALMSTSSLLHTLAASAVSALATTQSPSLLPLLALATAGLTLFPTSSSSFLHLSCGPRVLKTVLFGALYSFLYIIGPKTTDVGPRHHQAVTMGAVWVLLCTPYALVFVVVQVVGTLMQRDLLAAMRTITESTRAAGGDVITPTEAERKSQAFESDLEKALGSSAPSGALPVSLSTAAAGRSPWDKPVSVDVARLQQLAANGA